MLGMPTNASIADNEGFDVRNRWFGTYVQDTWRATRNLTLNFGLRFEYENGISEVENRAIAWFDPNAGSDDCRHRAGGLRGQSDCRVAGE